MGKCRRLKELLLGVVLAAIPLSDAGASGEMPPPYVSRALDAVVIEVNDDVRTAFDIDKNVSGAMVLSVKPGGIADKNKIAPGDVIMELYGTAIDSPIRIDEVAGYWLKHGKTNIGVSWEHHGKSHHRAAEMSMTSFDEAVALSSVSSWESISSSESFSYEEYASEYSEEMNQSYEAATEEIDQAEESSDYADEELDQSADANDDGISDSEEASDESDDGGDDGGGDDE